MSSKVEVHVKYEGADGSVSTLTGATPRWDGDLTTLPEACKLAVGKAIAPQTKALVARDEKIALLEAKLAERNTGKPKKVPNPASTGSPDGVVTSGLRASGKRRGK